MDQTFRNYEVIVSDSESNDRTRDIAQRWGCEVVVGPQKGPGYGRNIGANIAQGKILLFLDADVILPTRDFLKQQVEEFTARDLAAASCYSRPTEGRPLYRGIFAMGNLYMRLFQGIDPHAAYAIFAKKGVHEKVGGFDVSPVFREDHDYAKRINKFGKFGILESRGVLVSTRRFQEDGLMRTLKPWLLSEVLRPFGKQSYRKFNYKFGHYRNIDN